jgi:hypothetical protein
VGKGQSGTEVILPPLALPDWTVNVVPAVVHLMLAYTGTNNTAALDYLVERLPPSALALAEIKAPGARSYAVRGDEVAAVI